MQHLSDCKDLMRELIGLLQKESACLKQGLFQDLNDIATQKLSLMSALDRMMKEYTGEDMRSQLLAEAQHLARVSAENGLLLQGVFNGTKAAQASLVRLQQQAVQVGTYGRRGERHLLSENGVFNQKTV